VSIAIVRSARPGPIPPEVSQIAAEPDGPVIEVFADVGCPFTHVGLRRFVERRHAAGRPDVRLWVRAWPLEVVNATPLDAHFIAEEVDDLRAQVVPDLFGGFREQAFPSSSLPALSLAAAAYRRSTSHGEAVSLELRDLLFEQGVDIGDEAVLARVAAAHGLEPSELDASAVLADHAEGVRRGVVGSPHFFTVGGGWFCPALDVSRDPDGHLRITADPEAFETFLAACFT
jgi:predicted DsbA family dithiol-disulfide isomerase